MESWLVDDEILISWLIINPVYNWVHPIAKVNAFTRGMLVSNGTLRIQEVREVSAK